MYPSKILLFGEYSILLGSEALAIPYARFKGLWSFVHNAPDDIAKALESNQGLKSFVKQLKWMQSEQNIDFGLDVSRLMNDVENGLYFKSDIPGQAGLGSSGALVAAIFDSYAHDSSKSTDLLKLKKNLAQLESIYHGTSSGIDPLVSYLNSPVHVKANNHLEKINRPVVDILQKRGLFLVDSGNKGKTNDLVGHFNQRCQSDKAYFDRLTDQYIPLNNDCIHAILNDGDENHFFSQVRELSQFQLVLFEKMIPAGIASQMNFGIENHLFYLKLCGSGGGFFIGFSQNMAKTKEYFDTVGMEMRIF